jgi:hypothetical protein
MLADPTASDVVTPPAPPAPPNEQQAERLARDIVARFTRDPIAFAASRQVEPSAFMRDYLESLNRRLADFQGPPRVTGHRPPRRLATLGVDALAHTAAGLPAEGDVWLPEHAPHMGVAAVVGAVVAVATAVTSVVSAYTAVTSLIKHKPL